MKNLSAYDWITLISFFVAIVSLLFNFLQWKRQKSLEKDAAVRTSAGMNAGYQALWRIAEICDLVRASRQNIRDETALIKEVLSRIQEISGNADTGRATMNSISRDLFGARLFYEAPKEAQKKVSQENIEKGS